MSYSQQYSRKIMPSSSFMQNRKPASNHLERKSFRESEEYYDKQPSENQCYAEGQNPLNHSSYQEYQRINDQYDRQTKGQNSALDILKLELQNKKLAEDYNHLIDEFNEVAAENQELKINLASKDMEIKQLQQTLQNVETQREQVKRSIQELKSQAFKINLPSNQAQQEESQQGSQAEEEMRKKQKEQKLASLAAEVKVLKAQLTGRSKTESLESSNEHLLQQIKSLEQKNRDLKKELQSEKLSIRTKLQQKDKRIQQNEIHKSELIADKNKTIQTLSEKLKNKEVTADLTEIQLSKQKQKNRALERQLLDLKNRQNHRQSLISSASQYSDKKNTKQERPMASADMDQSSQRLIEQYKTTVEQYKQLMSKQSMEIQKTSRELSALKAQNHSLRSECTNIEEQITELITSKQELERQKKQLSRNCSQAEYKLEQANKEIISITRQISQLQITTGELSNKMIDIRFKDEEQQNIIQCLKKQNASLLQRAMARAKTNNNSTEQFENLQNQKILMLKELSENRQELEKFQVLANQLEQKNKKLQYNNSKLAEQIDRLKAAPKSQDSNSNKNSDDRKAQEQKSSESANKVLQDKIVYLQNKISKFNNLQAELRDEYQDRIRGLQAQIYRSTQQGNQQRQKLTSQRSDDQNKRGALTEDYIQQLVIEGLGDDKNQDDQERQNEEENKANKNIKEPDVVQQGNNAMAQTKSNNSSAKNSNQAVNKSAAQSSQRPVSELKDQIQLLKLQNKSLNSHLELLNKELSEHRNRENGKQQSAQNQPGPITDPKLSSLQEQCQRYQTVIQLLKIQKEESKQAIIQLKQALTTKDQSLANLQQQLQNLKKQASNLTQDNRNLQSLNEEINERYRKGIESFKKQMSEMNEQIELQKGKIQDKKREMKRVENEYRRSINQLQDENLILSAKLKKQEIKISNLQQQIKQNAEQTLQKVIISRSQLHDYKRTQSRLAQLDCQVAQLAKQKERIAAERQALERYCQQELSTVRNATNAERQVLLQKLAAYQHIQTQNKTQRNRTTQALQKQSDQTCKLQAQVDKLSRQNYNLKLQLSQALAEVNGNLKMCKQLKYKDEQLSKQHQQLKNAYELLVVEKSQYQKSKSLTSGQKIELDMAYKQIEKLNQVLMQKERCIHYYLSQPVMVGVKGDQRNDMKSIKNGQNQNKSLNYQSYNNGQSYKSNNKYGTSSTTILPSTTSAVDGHYGYPYHRSGNSHHQQQHQYPQPQSDKYYQLQPQTKSQPKQQNEQTEEFLVGGFRPEYCTFFPQYHQI